MSKTAARQKISAKKAQKKIRPPSGADRRKEWRFNLPLTAIVAGKLPRGKEFKEAAQLKNISSAGAYFCLDSGVVVGSKLNLLIDLPKEATEGKKLKLQIGGITVRLEKPDKETKKQGVAIRFHKNFKFIRSKKISR